MTRPEPPSVLDYAKPTRESPTHKRLIAAAVRIGVGAMLFVIAVAMPHPQGIWYFGDHPQWLVAIDSAGLTIGTSEELITLGWFPLLAIKMLVVAIPVWVMWRIARRGVPADAQSTAGNPGEDAPK